MSEERHEKEQMSKIGRLEIPTTLKNMYLITSKQLNPTEDPSMQLLGRYFDIYKTEMITQTFKLYLDVLGCDAEKLLNLKFSSLALDDRQAKYLCVILSYCAQLESIELSDCKLSDKGLTYIVKGLVHIPGLLKLDLSLNQLTAAGLHYFNRGLHHIQLLEYLDLSGLTLQPQDLHLIEEIVRSCSFLSCFKLELLNSDSACLAELNSLSQNFKCKNFLVSLKQDCSTQLLE